MTSDFHPYIRSHYYQHVHDPDRRHSAQPPHPYPYPYDHHSYHRPYPLNRSGSFDEGYPEYYYPRSYWDAPHGAPHYPPHPPPPTSRHSAYFDGPPLPLPYPHGPITSSSSSASRPSVDNGDHHSGGMPRPNFDGHPDDGEGEREKREGGEPQHRRGGSQSSSKFHNLRFKFGTDMPSTIDLKSAIESCHLLCRFALHYGNQVKNSNSTSHSTVGGSALGLDPIERANLQKIRSMNTTMLIGIQKAEKTGDPSSSSPVVASGNCPKDETPESDRMLLEEDIELDEMEESPLRFGPGQPWNVMVLELARASTSIFQLAIRIKAWVNMTPEERELDEEINMIRGKRCLLMDSTLAVPTVDQHGNLQKDWAVVPASTSTSKSFYQRQRDLEQQRQTHPAVQPKQAKSNNNSQAQSTTSAKHELGTSMDSNEMMTDRDGAAEGNVFKIPRRNSSTGGVSSTAAGRHDSLKNGAAAGTLVLAGGAGGAGARVGSTTDSDMSSSFTSNASSANSSLREGSRAYRSADGATRNSKNSDVPHQKYRKRAKRSQAPGRCQSCHSSDTPEWRRGPDGARTLCNACGLHYAKLLRRQNEQAQQSPSRISIALPSSNYGTTATNSSSTATTSTSSALTLSAPAPPVSAPTPASVPSLPTPAQSTAAEAALVNGSKPTSRPSSRTDSSFPVISFPFRRLHGLGKTDASSSSALATSAATATATTATSTATVMATTTSSERSGSASLSFSSTRGCGSRTLAEHQVVPRYDSQSGNAVPVGNNGHRGGSTTNTSQYQLLQRQQQQYQQMEHQKPHHNPNQQQQQSSSYMRDVDMDGSRVKC
ncbi:hypothetical protein BGW39_000065 [Mortierella sp. 14UC]|nr:hypothetical protein BGW39_000065 [Mortierella sp. 14UC]